MKSLESLAGISRTTILPFSAWARKLESIRPFTPNEAWTLFRIAALSEAVGWTLLISGIGIARYHLPGSGIAIPIAGQIHGTIFIAYFGVLLATYTSLGWSRKKALVAVAAGIPPYGTLLFELWAARKRRKTEQISYRRVLVHAIISTKRELLVIQPSSSTDWIIPGGVVAGVETPEQAVVRSVQQLTGITPSIKGIRHVQQSVVKPFGLCMEFYFDIANVRDFRKLDFIRLATKNPAVDEIGFMNLTDLPDLLPDFLRTA